MEECLQALAGRENTGTVERGRRVKFLEGKISDRIQLRPPGASEFNYVPLGRPWGVLRPPGASLMQEKIRIFRLWFAGRSDQGNDLSLWRISWGDLGPGLAITHFIKQERYHPQRRESIYGAKSSIFLSDLIFKSNFQSPKSPVMKL